jgi:hypothetical protein
VKPGGANACLTWHYDYRPSGGGGLTECAIFHDASHQGAAFSRADPISKTNRHPERCATKRKRRERESRDPQFRYFHQLQVPRVALGTTIQIECWDGTTKVVP